MWLAPAAIACTNVSTLRAGWAPPINPAMRNVELTIAASLLAAPYMTTATTLRDRSTAELSGDG